MNRHKLAAVTILGACPTIVTLLAVLTPLMGDTPMPIKAAVLVPLMVGLLTYVVMPILTRVFAGWLRNDDPSRISIVASLGLAIVPLALAMADSPEQTESSTPPPSVSALDGLALDHVMVNVGDFYRSVKWYHDKLGFDEVVRWTVDGLDGTNLAQVQRGSFLIEIASGPTTNASFQASMMSTAS